MSIFVGVTMKEVGQIEDAVREYLMNTGLDTSEARIEARNVYLEDDGTFRASLIVTGFPFHPVARSTYILVKNEEGFFKVKA